MGREGAVNYLAEKRVPSIIESVVVGLTDARPDEGELFHTIEAILRDVCNKRFVEWREDVAKTKEGELAKGLVFAIPERPGLHGLELKPGGRDITVNKENVAEFVDLVEKHVGGLPNQSMVDGTLSTYITATATESHLINEAFLHSVRTSLNVLMITNFPDEDWARFGLTWAGPDPTGTGGWVPLITDGLTAPVEQNDKLRFVLSCKAAADRAEENLLADVQQRRAQRALSRLRSQGQELSKEQWKRYNFTWTAPVQGGLTELVPGGRGRLVSYHERDAYLAAIGEAEKSGMATVEAEMLRRFSPTHFAKDLFSPMPTTSSQVKLPEAASEKTDHYRDRLTSLKNEFECVVDAIEEEDYDQVEWEGLGITWCAFTGGTCVDLAPDGRNVEVALDDKLEYCRIARACLSRVPRPTPDTAHLPDTEEGWQTLCPTWSVAATDGTVTDYIEQGQCIPVPFYARAAYVEMRGN